MSKRNYEIIGEFEFEGKQAEKILNMIDTAEKEIEEARIFFRWNKKQLNLVKEAAALSGVPYQTYIKMVLYNQSIRDIKESKETLNKNNNKKTKNKKEYAV